MLSNHDIDELVTKMGISNFKGCFYKDKLSKIQPNSSYIINLNSELDEKGNVNKGSHWVALLTACPCSACCGFCSLLWGEY